MPNYYSLFIVLLAVFSVALANLEAIKPRFPLQFSATIAGGQEYRQYPCLYDGINEREKCQIGPSSYQIRNFKNDSFTETNFTTDYPPKCNISTNIKDAKLLNPDWFNKLNLSLISSASANTWMFSLKKPTLLEELPFAPKFVSLFGDRGQQQFLFSKIRNIVGVIQTADPDFTWPTSLSITFNAPGYECNDKYRNPLCRQQYFWSFTKQPSKLIESGAIEAAELVDALFTLPSFLPPCLNVDQSEPEAEEEDD